MTTYSLMKLYMCVCVFHNIDPGLQPLEITVFKGPLFYKGVEMISFLSKNSFLLKAVWIHPLSRLAGPRATNS